MKGKYRVLCVPVVDEPIGRHNQRAVLPESHHLPPRDTTTHESIRQEALRRSMREKNQSHLVEEHIVVLRPEAGPVRKAVIQQAVAFTAATVSSSTDCKINGA